MNPAIEKENRYFMTKETWKNGAEISSAGRFFSNAILPVLHSALTMLDSGAQSELPEAQNIDNPPTKHMTFGDSFTAKDKVPGSQPDVVFLVYSENLPEVRMVGEMKFHVTVDLKKYHKLAQHGENGPLGETLGEFSPCSARTPN